MTFRTIDAVGIGVFVAITAMGVGVVLKELVDKLREERMR